MTASGFPGITGYDDIIKYLRKAAETGHVSHAYLMTGEEGCGKRTLALRFAMMLLCEEKDPKARPCMKCSACRRALSGNHPDLIRVTHEKPGSIRIDEIRDQLIATADIRPYEDKRKIYIIPEAEKMNPQAQNALLKTLEEPPEFVVIMLLSTNPDILLPTVLSRCVKLPLIPLPDRVVEEYVREKLEMPDYEARVIAAFAQGNIGKAEKAVRDEAFSDRRERILALVRGIGSMNAATIREAVRYMAEEKDEIGRMLDIMLLCYRDILYYKAAVDVDRLVFSDEISLIREKAKLISYEGLTDIIDAIEMCRTRLRANVNAELAVELLLYKIRENDHA